MPGYRVTARVVRILEGGSCPQGLSPGMEFDLPADEPIPRRFARHALGPAWRVLQFGGRFSWRRDPDAPELCCPDPNNPVVFEVRRSPRPG